MHPCRICDVYITTGLNTGPDCKDCDAKAKYVASLGDMTHAVPDHMTTYGGKEKGAFMAPDPDKKVCKNRDCEYGGEPQLMANFPGKRGGGKKDVCKSCVSKAMKAAKAKKAKKDPSPGMKKTGVWVEETLVDKTANITASSGERLKTDFVPVEESFKDTSIKPSEPSVITIDLTGHPKILEGLKAIAEKELRTTENFAQYIIHRVVNDNYLSTKR